jgi:hypothetical protein
MDEADIRQAAAEMIKLYGAQAEQVANVRANEMLIRGNQEGAYTWKRVVDAIRDRQKPGASEPVSQ